MEWNCTEHTKFQISPILTETLNDAPTENNMHTAHNALLLTPTP